MLSLAECVTHLWVRDVKAQGGKMRRGASCGSLEGAQREKPHAGEKVISQIQQVNSQDISLSYEPYV